MDKNESQVFFGQCRIVCDSLADEIVQCSNGFHARKATTRHDESQHRASCLGVVGETGYFQHPQHVIAQDERVPEDFMVSARSATPGKLKKLDSDPNAMTKLIIGLYFPLAVEAVSKVTSRVSRSIASTSASRNRTCLSMGRRGQTISDKSMSPAATSCSMGVKRTKFSRLTRVTSTAGSAAIIFSKCRAEYKPPKPPPRMTTLVRAVELTMDGFIVGGDRAARAQTAEAVGFEAFGVKRWEGIAHEFREVRVGRCAAAR